MQYKITLIIEVSGPITASEIDETDPDIKILDVQYEEIKQN